MSAGETQVLAIVQIVLFAITVRERVWERYLTRRWQQTATHLEDPATGLLTLDSLELRLGPQLAWASIAGAPLVLVRIEVEGSDLDAIGRRLGQVARSYEDAYRLAPSSFVISLWSADLRVAAQAIGRIGAELVVAGATAIAVGMARYPHDGEDVEHLLSCCNASITRLSWGHAGNRHEVAA